MKLRISFLRVIYLPIEDLEFVMASWNVWSCILVLLLCTVQAGAERRSKSACFVLAAQCRHCWLYIALLIFKNMFAFYHGYFTSRNIYGFITCYNFTTLSCMQIYPIFAIVSLIAGKQAETVPRIKTAWTTTRQSAPPSSEIMY